MIGIYLTELPRALAHDPAELTGKIVTVGEPARLGDIGYFMVIFTG